MEEKKMKEMGLELIDSSHLSVRGGANYNDLVSLVKSIVDFIINYLPSLKKGYKDGFNRKK